MYSREYRVRMADTDAAGLIYFASLLRIAHTVYEMFMEDAGIDAAKLLPKGIGLPIAHTDADYHGHIGLGDRLMVEMTVERIGKTSFTTAYRILKGETLAAEARLVHVSVDRTAQKPIPLPDFARKLLEPHLVPFVD